MDQITEPSTTNDSLLSAQRIFSLADYKRRPKMLFQCFIDPCTVRANINSNRILIIKAGNSIEKHSCIYVSQPVNHICKLMEVFDMVCIDVESVRTSDNNIEFQNRYELFPTTDIEGFKKMSYELDPSGVYISPELFRNNIYYSEVENYLRATLRESYRRFLSCNNAVYNTTEFLAKDRIRIQSPSLFNLKPLIIKNVKDFTLEELGVKSSTYAITEGNKRTFGVELETSEGVVPPHITKTMNISAVYDGSLKTSDGEVRGGEYVTGILRGDNGFRHLRHICRELSAICRINKRCGVHVHIASDKSRESITALYILCFKIQSEIYALVSTSRRNNEYCRGLELNLPSSTLCREDMSKTDWKFTVDKLYTELFGYVAGTSDISGLTRKGNHPKGHKCGYDHDSQRYCWVNFVPTMFNTRNDGTTYTVEFRNHPGSLSYTKIKNWVKLCLAIVNYASNNSNKILCGVVPSLTEIIKAEYPKTSNKMLSYFSQRALKFSRNDSNTMEDLNELMEGDTSTNNSIKNDL